MTEKVVSGFDAFLSSLLDDLERERAYAVTVSPLYGAVFRVFIEACEDTAFVRDLAALWQERTAFAWFERPLLLAAALHRVVQGGGAPALGVYYATCGGAYGANDYAAFRERALALLRGNRAGFIGHLRVQKLQTNETARGITWLYPLSRIWRARPGRVGVFEIGCSAGLNLMADQYSWEIGTRAGRQVTAGSVAISVEFDHEYPAETGRDLLDGIAGLSADLAIRAGCDLSVPDIRRQDDREMLEAMIWGDDLPRLTRLRAAIDRARPLLDQGLLRLKTEEAIAGVREAARLFADQLDDGDIACFYNTVVTCYFDDDAYAQLRREIEQAFAGLLARARCVWIEHEPLRGPTQYPDVYERFDSVVRISELDVSGLLVTRIIAGTEMHPRKIVWLEAAVVGAVLVGS